MLYNFFASCKYVLWLHNNSFMFSIFQKTLFFFTLLLRMASSPWQQQWVRWVDQSSEVEGRL